VQRKPPALHSQGVAGFGGLCLSLFLSLSPFGLGGKKEKEGRCGSQQIGLWPPSPPSSLPSLLFKNGLPSFPFQKKKQVGKEIGPKRRVKYFSRLFIGVA
jgi:hypothetical protein